MNPINTSTPAPRRFLAPTSKEALRLARACFGDGALVLASRAHPEGFEIVAMGDGEAAALVEAAASAPALLPPSDPALQGAGGGADSVLSELHSMRSMIEERLASVVWSDQQRRDPVRGRLLLFWGCGERAGPGRWRLTCPELHVDGGHGNHCGRNSSMNVLLAPAWPLLSCRRYSTSTWVKENDTRSTGVPFSSTSMSIAVTRAPPRTMMK